MSNIFPNFTIKKIISIHSQQIRWFPRWSNRRPVRVIPAKEYDEQKDTQIKTLYKNKIFTEKSQPVRVSQKINWKQPKPNSVPYENSNKLEKHADYKLKTNKNQQPLTISKLKNAKVTEDMLEMIIDSDGNCIYTKMKNNDTRISSILVELKSKKEQHKKELILLEGKRLIKDALEASCKLEYILFSRIKELDYLKPFLPKMGAKLYKMPYREMQIWSNLDTNPGIMGVFKVPNTENIPSLSDSLPITIICDNVREPNNLGAILRTSSGAGCSKVILTKGCVNVWDSKVLRSASGAHFKLNIKNKLNWDQIREEIDPSATIYVADNLTLTTASDNNDTLSKLLQDIPVLPYYGVDYRTADQIVLIIGGETEGISEDSYYLAAELKGARLNVPLSNQVDSLNTGTALGIIVFEMKRQLSSLSKTKESLPNIL